MNRNYSISNALSVYNVICMSNKFDHYQMSVGQHSAMISVYGNFQDPELRNLKKELIPACTENCGFEIKNFEKDDKTRAFSILEMTWEW